MIVNVLKQNFEWFCCCNSRVYFHVFLWKCGWTSDMAPIAFSFHSLRGFLETTIVGFTSEVSLWGRLCWWRYLTFSSSFFMFLWVLLKNINMSEFLKRFVERWVKWNLERKIWFLFRNNFVRVELKFVFSFAETIMVLVSAEKCKTLLKILSFLS